MTRTTIGLLAIGLLAFSPPAAAERTEPPINLSLEEGARLGQLVDVMLAGSIIVHRNKLQPQLGDLIGNMAGRLGRSPKSEWARPPTELDSIRLPAGSGATGSALQAVPNAWHGPDNFSLDVFNGNLGIGRITVRRHSIVVTPREEPVLWAQGVFGGEMTGHRHELVNTYKPAPQYCATGGLCISRADGKVILARRSTDGYRQVARCLPGTIGFSCLVESGLVKQRPAVAPRFQLGPAARQVTAALSGRDGRVR